MAGIGCTSVVPTPTPAPPSFFVPERTPSAYGQECQNFKADPARDSFIGPTNTVYSDDLVPDWPTASPGDVGLDADLVQRAADNAALSTDVRSLLIVKDGLLVEERYYNGADEGDAFVIASVSKSILGLLTGIAIRDGFLQLDTELREVLPENLVGDNGDLTVEDLLTMSAGLRVRANEVEYDEDVQSDVPGEPSFVRAVLARDSVTAAGDRFEYSTGLTQVLAAVLTEASGRSLCEYAADVLLGPLGIDADGWWIEPGGYFAGGHSMFMTPRELARFGQLVLDHGSYNGEQLVPGEWLDQSLAERWDLGCVNRRPIYQGYGFLWWLYDLDGYTVWNASGWGGQEIWLVPELDLEVVITHDTSNAYQPGNFQIQPGTLIRAAVTDSLPPKESPRCDSEQFSPVEINPDGTGRAEVAGWPEGALATDWSPDGQRLAVAHDRWDLTSEIYTVLPNGLGRVRLTSDGAVDVMPAWSPNGDLVAYARGEPGQMDIYIVNAYEFDAGESLSAPVTHMDGYEEAPAWSPGGTRIAFVWGHEDTNGFGQSGELWAVDPDGENLVQLLEQPIGYPDWSPDGNRIALEMRGAEPHIGIFDLRDDSLVDLGPGYVPKWSPDGSRIVFVREMFSSFEIIVSDPDGSNELQLTDDGAFDTFPIWSPDGQTIRFMSRGGDS